MYIFCFSFLFLLLFSLLFRYLTQIETFTLIYAIWNCISNDNTGRNRENTRTSPVNRSFRFFSFIFMFIVPSFYSFLLFAVLFFFSQLDQFRLFVRVSWSILYFWRRDERSKKKTPKKNEVKDDKKKDRQKRAACDRRK